MTELKNAFLKEIMENGKNANLKLFIEEDLYDLIDWSASCGFTDGIECTFPSINGSREINLLKPRITIKGKEYLKLANESKNNSPIKVEVINEDLKNISNHLQGLNEGQQEMVKLMSEHIEVLEEIKLLSADKVTVMKEELIRLKESDNKKNIPWDTLINLTSLIVSVSSKVG